MSLPLFVYNLPEDRIAQRPIVPYHDARLLVINRSTGALTDSTFLELPSFLSTNDLLVFNNTKVIQARLLGEFETGGKVELLLLRKQKDPNIWSALGRPMKKFTLNRQIRFAKDLKAFIKERLSDQEVIVQFEGADPLSSGIMPIPPYIRSGLSDQEDIKDYQTPFAEIDGSVAAPTASLHFTKELMERLVKRNILSTYLTLHLGPASFLPIFDSKNPPTLSDLKSPATESLIYSDNTKKLCKEIRANVHKVVAVGTSMVRALETLERTKAEEGEAVETDLYIKPGHEFLSLDSVITNFHQPGTTHLLLVEALLGKELLEESYNHALNNGYRFLSYGDGMLIL